MTTTNILIVEDEPSIADVLIAYCEAEGFAVTHLSSGANVISHIEENATDLVLLDLMLPDVDGFTICKGIRLISDVAIIMVTAKNEEIYKLAGLDYGADDYICKPFNPREVIARVKTVLRRMGEGSNQKLKQAGYILEQDKFKLTLNGKIIDLTPTEFKIFELLLNHPDRVFSREDILNNVYHNTSEASLRNIDTHIKKVRKKINLVSEDANPISTVYGVGYKFSG
jgi:two-component system response regulator BaeR